MCSSLLAQSVVDLEVALCLQFNVEVAMVTLSCPAFTERDVPERALAAGSLMRKTATDRPCSGYSARRPRSRGITFALDVSNTSFQSNTSSRFWSPKRARSRKETSSGPRSVGSGTSRPRCARLARRFPRSGNWLGPYPGSARGRYSSPRRSFPFRRASASRGLSPPNRESAGPGKSSGAERRGFGHATRSAPAQTQVGRAARAQAPS
jgi:hypothetical protein